MVKLKVELNNHFSRNGKIGAFSLLTQLSLLGKLTMIGNLARSERRASANHRSTDCVHGGRLTCSDFNTTVDLRWKLR